MIEVRELKKNFGSQPILNGVNFRIEKGESVVIIGRSGGGKSVLLKHIIGLIKPDSGQVLIDNEDIVPMDERALLRVRQKFGMVFQGAALFDSMTVAENVAFPFRLSRTLTQKAIAQKVAAALEMVELPGTENKKPSELSGGMRKRVGLARSIIYEPAIMLYDEPTTGLDPVVSDSIDRLIIRVRDRLKVTTIVVTHDMRSARRVGQRILMLRDKRIYAGGTADEIFMSSDPVIRQFVDGISELSDATQIFQRAVGHF
jgi:phospholipid/cholesterol/gamma-HCH transport system ATP-binding protein